MEQSKISPNTGTSSPPASQDTSDYFWQLDSLSKIRAVLNTLLAISIVMNLYTATILTSFIFKIFEDYHSITHVSIMIQTSAMFLAPLLPLIVIENVILTIQNKKLDKINLPEVKKYLKTSRIVRLISELPILIFIVFIIISMMATS